MEFLKLQVGEVVRVYCDTGGFVEPLLDLEKRGLIKIYTYPYEMKNNKIKTTALPSAMTWDDMITPWDSQFYPWKEYVGSNKFTELQKVLGNNRKDILHLDSAYKSGCHFFVTSDKDDIHSKRDRLLGLLNIRICLHSNLNPILDLLIADSSA